MATLTPTWTQYVYDGSNWSALTASAIYTINDATIQGTASNYKQYPIRIPSTAGTSNYSAETYIGIVWSTTDGSTNVPSNVKIWESSGTLKDTAVTIWAGVTPYDGTGSLPGSGTRIPSVPPSGTTGSTPFSGDTSLSQGYAKFLYNGSTTDLGSDNPISLPNPKSATPDTPPYYSDIVTFLLEVPQTTATTGNISDSPVVITVQYDEA